jgi:hypothetical protein
MAHDTRRVPETSPLTLWSFFLSVFGDPEFIAK